MAEGEEKKLGRERERGKGGMHLLGEGGVHVIVERDCGGICAAEAEHRSWIGFLGGEEFEVENAGVGGKVRVLGGKEGREWKRRTLLDPWRALRIDATRALSVHGEGGI